MSTVTRPLPAWIAPVAAHLELEDLTLVRTADIVAAVEEAGGASAPSRIIQELAEKGWLLPTGVHGVWEFAPARRGRPHPGQDPFLTFKAVLMSTPEPNGVAVALRSAMWLRDVADRPPDRHEIAMPKIKQLSPGLTRSLRQKYRLTSFAPKLEPSVIGDVPVHQLESVLVHLAANPTAVRGWQSILEAFNDLLTDCDPSRVAEEAADRRPSTLVRLAYLTADLRPELTEALRIERGGVVWFGPRGDPVRFDPRWNIVDTVLPVRPGVR